MSEWTLVEAEVSNSGRNNAPSMLIAYLKILIVNYVIFLEREFNKRNENGSYNSKWDNQNQNQSNRTENRGRGGNGNNFRSQGQANVSRNRNNGMYAVYQM